MMRSNTNTKTMPFTALNNGLCACQTCGLVSRLTEDASHPHLTQHCSRCHGTLHSRKKNSIAHCWAFLITAYLLYIPANLLPIMDTNSLFNAKRDTIMSGIVYLWHSGAWFLAIVVFFASIVTPVFKMIALTYLLFSIKFKSKVQAKSRTKLFNFLHAIGRWSMLDIFMVAILVTLVNIQSLTVIKASPGAVAFAAVVILTMLAVESFDVRLIWDNDQSDHSTANNQSNDALLKEHDE